MTTATTYGPVWTESNCHSNAPLRDTTADLLAALEAVMEYHHLWIHSDHTIKMAADAIAIAKGEGLVA